MLSKTISNVVSLMGACLRPSFFYALLLAMFISACSSSDQPSATLDNANETIIDGIHIYRDKYGTPHVVANTNYDVYFGYGYVVATDRLFQMEILKRTVEGRVAEVLGAEYAELDTHVRTAYDHRSVNQQLAQLKPQDLEILQAYADGFSKRVNIVLANQKSLLPKEFVHFDFEPEPWSAYDVAMIFIGSIIHRYSDFNSELDNLGLLNQLAELHGEEKAAQIFNASKWLVDPTSPTTVPRELNVTASAPAEILPKPLTDIGRPSTKRVVLNGHGQFLGTTADAKIREFAYAQISEQGFTGPEYQAASNFWSVNKNLLDADGVLVNGPQFGFGLPSYVFGIGLHGGDFNAVGNTLLGLPTLLFAHNNHIGWGSTAGMSDQVDVYREQLIPGKPDHYRHNDQDKKFDMWSETILVRDSEPLTVTARRSVHGMVVQLDEARNVAFTRARAWEGAEVATLMAWVNLAKDKSMDAVQSRLSKVAANINFYYMDADGNIGYTHGGRYPLRAPGHDSRLTADGTGQYDWQGYRPYSENPTVRNPQQGFIVNWNNRPAAGWQASDLWTYTWSKADRSIHITEELNSAEKLSVDDVWAINEAVSYDDVSISFLFPYLRQALQVNELDKITAQAWKTLSQWDREWRTEGDGQYGAAELIVETWTKHLFDTVIKDDVGDKLFAMYSSTNNPNNPLGPSMPSSVGVKVLLRNLDLLSSNDSQAGASYDFFNGQNPSNVLYRTFTESIAQLAKQHGDDLSAWSLAPATMTWKPLNFRGVPQALPDSVMELPAYMNRGSENNLFIVRDGHFTAFDVIPPGQSGFIAQSGDGSEHVADQMRLYSDFDYKPIPFTLEEVRKVSVSSELITNTVSLEADSSRSAVENIKGSLAKAERLKDLSAFTYIDEESALSAAKRVDSEFDKAIGQLQGIPIAVKDNIHVVGMPNSAGTVALKDFYPIRNNPVIQRLVDAGAIILGKTNMHELAFGITSNNAAFGAVRNAHDSSRIAGGSSGGTAVAVAAGIVDFGLGTDTGGSTRIPPALNGVVGFRPTLGRYPSGGVTPVSSSRDTVGPITRNVEQLALLDCVITNCSDDFKPADLKGLRLGVPREYFYDNLSEDVRNIMQASLDKLAAAGVELVEVEMPGLEEANNGSSFPVALYEVMQELPVYLAENKTNVSFDQLVKEIASPDVKATIESQIGETAMPEEVYQQARSQFVPKLKSIYQQTFERYGVAALVVPTTPLAATPIATSDETVELNGAQVPTFPTFIRNTDPTSNAGLPSLTLPAGRNENNMPIGLMLDGPAGSDRQLIEIAFAIETLLSFE